MKYEVKWTAHNSLIQSDIVESLNGIGAQSQVESMRGSMPGFHIIGTYAYNEPIDYSSSNSSTSTSSSEGYDMDFSANIVVFGLGVSALLFIWGLATISSTGILAMILGGFIGWLAWKVGSWLADRGW